MKRYIKRSRKQQEIREVQGDRTQLTGHAGMAHAPVSVRVGHGAPLPSGGVVMVRVRDRVPFVPHAPEQVDHALQQIKIRNKSCRWIDNSVY